MAFRDLEGFRVLRASIGARPMYMMVRSICARAGASDALAAQDQPTPVTIAEAKLEDWRGQLDLTGTLTTARRSVLSTQVDGRVLELLVAEGE